MELRHLSEKIEKVRNRAIGVKGRGGAKVKKNLHDESERSIGVILRKSRSKCATLKDEDRLVMMK